MKKIIAAALSILVGACGYTIVDKAMEKRVEDLEKSMSSLVDENNSLHYIKEYSTERIIYTTKQTTTTTTKSTQIMTQTMPTTKKTTTTKRTTTVEITE